MTARAAPTFPARAVPHVRIEMGLIALDRVIGAIAERSQGARELADQLWLRTMFIWRAQRCAPGARDELLQRADEILARLDPNVQQTTQGDTHA